MVWNEIVAIGAIGTLGTFIVTLYRWVYLPRKAEKERKIEEVYKPIYGDVKQVIMNAENFQTFWPGSDWKLAERKIPPELYNKLEDLFDKRYEKYLDFFRASEYLINYYIVYFAYINRSVRNLSEEFDKLGGETLAEQLKKSITLPIIRGEDVNLIWFEENCTGLYEKIMKCQNHKYIKTIFHDLKYQIRNDFTAQSFLTKLREAREDVIDFAKELAKEMEEKYLK